MEADGGVPLWWKIRKVCVPVSRSGRPRSEGAFEFGREALQHYAHENRKQIKIQSLRFIPVLLRVASFAKIILAEFS